jgi:hypothetical protein
LIVNRRIRTGASVRGLSHLRVVIHGTSQKPRNDA